MSSTLQGCMIGDQKLKEEEGKRRELKSNKKDR
jgi:hypothetical protein